MSRRALSVAADVCLIAAALAGVWRIWNVHRHETPAFGQNDPSTEMVGVALKHVDVDWNRTATNLVMVLNEDCHYCSESAPFYQRLIGSVGNRVQVVALFTHDLPAAKTYLDRLGLGVSVNRGSVSFPRRVMTPTLMLCDTTGKITRVWIGKLTGAEESEVLSSVAAVNPPAKL